MILELNNKQIEIEFEIYHGEVFVNAGYYIDTGVELTESELNEVQEFYNEELIEEAGSFAGMGRYDSSKG